MDQRQFHTQGGFTLIETMLVVGLLSGIMLVLTVLMQDYMHREKMSGAANYLLMVQRAVNESINTVEEFNTLYDLALANGNVMEISILDPANPGRTVGYAPTGGISLESGGSGLSPNNIIHAGFDPAAPGTYSQFRDTLPLRAANYVAGIDGPQDNPFEDVRLTVVAKIVDDPADLTDDRAMEILVTSIDRIDERDLRDVSEFLGANGGLISAADDVDAATNCDAAGCEYTARSAYGNWYTGLPTFSGVNWYNIMSANPAALDEGGYLVSYRYINEALLAGDYLYRNEISGSPHLNQMHTALDIGGNNIIGADNVEITPDASSTGAALSVGRSLYTKNSAFIENDLQVDGDLVVDGDLGAATLTVAPGYDVTDPGLIPSSYGNVIVGNVFNTGSMAAAGDVYAQNADLAGLQSPQTSTLGLGIAGSATVSATEGVFTVGLEANAIGVSGLTQAGQVGANTITGESVGYVQSEMDGGLSVSTDSLTANKVSTTGTLTINNVVTCRLGC